MTLRALSQCIPSADAMTEFGQRFGSVLRTRDTVLLEGDIGSGKTHFARAVLQSLMATPEDVPSPTFTLVQTYNLPIGTVWHADLYRLSDSSEVIELGLDDAFNTDICLVEWPERLGVLTPKHATKICFQVVGVDARRLTIEPGTVDWQARLEDLL